MKCKILEGEKLILKKNQEMNKKLIKITYFCGMNSEWTTDVAVKLGTVKLIYLLALTNLEYIVIEFKSG